jgi:hypothetical protein
MNPPGDMIGAAIFFPLPGACSALAVDLFKAGLTLAMRGLDIEMAGSLNSFGLIVCLAEVKDRKAALLAVQAFAASLQVHTEVAFYDFAEGYWRTVYPKKAAPFGRLFTSEMMDLARKQAADDVSQLKIIEAILKARRQSKDGES